MYICMFVYEQLRATVINPKASVDFVIDRPAASFDVWLSNRSSEMEIDSESVQIFADSGVVPQVKRITTDRSFLALRVENAMVTKWTCKLNHDSPLFLKIAVTLRDADALSVEVWVHDTTQKVDSSQMPVILFARVVEGPHPVVNASVNASIKPPNGEAVTFHLLDNGAGDPDITKNDGIYSRYFVDFSTVGEYQVVVSVSDNEGNAKVAKPKSQGITSPCCGSEVFYERKEDIAPFYREKRLSFTAKREAHKSGYGPSTILDLSASLVSANSFRLRWTAPGGRKDHGRAAKYVLKQFQKYEDLTKPSGEIKTNNLRVNDAGIIPKEHGEIDEMDLLITDDTLRNTSYFLSLTSSDGTVTSAPSNIIEIFVPLKDVILEGSSTTPPSNATDDSVNSAGLSGATIWYIVGAVLAAIFIISAYIGFYCFVKRKEKRERESSKQGKSENPNNISIKKDDSTSNDGSVTASEWRLERDPISPVNSVPAAVLIHHHEQVRDAKRKNKKPPMFKLEQLNESGNQLSIRRVEDSPNTTMTSKQPLNASDGIIQKPEQLSEYYSDPYKRYNSADSPKKPLRKVTHV